MGKNKKLKKAKKEVKLAIINAANMDKLKTMYIKKKDIGRIKGIDNLRNIFDHIEDNANPKRVQKIFMTREQILKNAADAYIELEEDQLFDITIDELKVIRDLLSK